MRILHLDSGREMRGGQWQVLRLLEGLSKLEIPGCLLARASSPLFEKANRLGLEVCPFSLPALAARARTADLVHAHDARSHGWAVAVARCPVIVSRRVAFPLHTGALSRWKYGRAAHYIAVSQFVQRVLMEGGVPESKISVVYDGVPLRDTPASGELIVAPATEDARKGTDLALEAARMAGIRLHLSSDLETDLGHAKLFLYVSYCEGLGSGVLLAMAAGVPVIASGVGGLLEAIQQGKNGLLAGNTPEALAAAMRRLLDDPALARALSSCARRVAAERFSVDMMVQNTVRVYERLA